TTGRRGAPQSTPPRGAWERVETIALNPDPRQSLPSAEEPLPSRPARVVARLDHDARRGRALDGNALGGEVLGRGAVLGLRLARRYGLDPGDEPVAAGLEFDPVPLALVAVGVDGLDGDVGGAVTLGVSREDRVTLPQAGGGGQVGGERLAAALGGLAVEPRAE